MKIKTGSATEEQVRRIRIPREFAPTRTFQPLTHAQVLDHLEGRMNERGLELDRDPVSELHRKEFTLAANGAKMYVALPLKSRIDPEMQEMVCIVHSFNKQLALRIGFGSECSYCLNGLVFAAVVLRMKHCPGTFGDENQNIDDAIDSALDQRGFFIEQQQGFYNRLRKTELDDKDVNDFIMRSAMAEAIMPTETIHVRAQWDEPRFEAFEPRTAFSLMNAFTDVFRRGSETRTNGVATRNGPKFVERSTRLVQMLAEDFAPDLCLEFDPNNN